MTTTTTTRVKGMKIDPTSTLDVKNDKMDWTNLFFEI